MSCHDLTLGPAQVPLFAGKLLDEMGTWHARRVDGQSHDAALAGADSLYELPYAPAQTLDLLRPEADAQQFARNCVACLQVGAATRAVSGERALQALVARAKPREPTQSVLLQLECGSGLVCAIFFVLVLLFPKGSVGFIPKVFRYRSLAGRRFAGAGSGQAIHHIIDLDFAALDPFGELENLGNCNGAGRDGHDHVAQPVLDA